jgi:hypothetical protein
MPSSKPQGPIPGTTQQGVATPFIGQKSGLHVPPPEEPPVPLPELPPVTKVPAPDDPPVPAKPFDPPVDEASLDFGLG